VLPDFDVSFVFFFFFFLFLSSALPLPESSSAMSSAGLASSPDLESVDLSEALFVGVHAFLRISALPSLINTSDNPAPNNVPIHNMRVFGVSIPQSPDRGGEFPAQPLRANSSLFDNCLYLTIIHRIPGNAKLQRFFEKVDKLGRTPGFACRDVPW